METQPFSETIKCTGTRKTIIVNRNFSGNPQGGSSIHFFHIELECRIGFCILFASFLSSWFLSAFFSTLRQGLQAKTVLPLPKRISCRVFESKNRVFIKFTIYVNMKQNLTTTVCIDIHTAVHTYFIIFPQGGFSKTINGN